MRVFPGDAFYRARAKAEAEFCANRARTAEIFETAHTGALKRFSDGSHTGDPAKSWMDDLIARGPFTTAAQLGCSEGSREAMWMTAAGNSRLDVYDPSPAALAKTRAYMTRKRGRIHWPDWRVRFFAADFNFVALPRERYDVVWTTATLHHATNLEYVIDEVARSLRPGGLFALHDYIGERRLCYAPERLDWANAVLRRIPPRFRLIESVEAPGEEDKSPFEAVRSEETLDVVRARFDVVHLAEVDALFPLLMLVNFAELEKEEPALVQMIFDEELEARAAGLHRCSAYGVFRKREQGNHR